MSKKYLKKYFLKGWIYIKRLCYNKNIARQASFFLKNRYSRRKTKHE